VIRKIAGIISDNIKNTDRAARFGGEEFVVLLREVDQATAHMLADRIRCAIESAVMGDGETRFSATVSIGIAAIAEADRDVQDMIERADQALYVAKNSGRNRCCWPPATEIRGFRAA